MKILLMGFAKIKYMPYLYFYLEQIDRARNEVHLLYWNRDEKAEDLSALSGVTLHEFRLYQEDEVPQLSKLRNFLCYRRFAQGVLREKFDLVISLHSFPGVLLADRLIREYRGRFLFDYRDKTYEGFPPFRWIIHKLVRISQCTFVSSDGFRALLPASEQHKIHTSHNLLTEDLKVRASVAAVPSDAGRIRIGFWGILRNEEMNRALIRQVAEDPRFELHYYGREQSTARRLKEYARSLGTDRVCFHGEYVPGDRAGFAAQTDLLHNLYDDGNMMLAMSNKYYDGMIFRIPQLCMKGSHMARAAEAAGIGFGCDPHAGDFLESVAAYYRELDQAAFARRCDAALEIILEDYGAGCRVIRAATGSDPEM